MTIDESPASPVESDVEMLEMSDESQTCQSSRRPTRMPVDPRQRLSHSSRRIGKFFRTVKPLFNPTDSYYPSNSPKPRTSRARIYPSKSGEASTVQQSRYFRLGVSGETDGRLDQTTSLVGGLFANPLSRPGQKVDSSASDDGRQAGRIRPQKNVNPADLKIAYLHRTARDFLERPDIWSIIMADSPEGFDVQRALMRALILALKTSQPS